MPTCDNAKGTVIFDFDSTLVTCESLEYILSRTIGDNAEVMREVKRITAQGMDGSLPFAESLRRRLAIARPSRASVTACGRDLVNHITPGMDALIRFLHSTAVDVWIVSGGIYEAVLPAAEQLNINSARVLAVHLLWSDGGTYKSPDPSDPSGRSKCAAARTVWQRWRQPCVAVGDGMTDRELWEAGLVQHFIAFTMNVRRESVCLRAPMEATNMSELKNNLTDILPI